MVRVIVSALDKIEKMAMASSDVNIIGIGDVDERELFHDGRRVRQ